MEYGVWSKEIGVKKNLKYPYFKHQAPNLQKVIGIGIRVREKDKG